MAKTTELMAVGIPAAPAGLLGDGNAVTSTYDGQDVIPASSLSAGFAITNNYLGFGEVDFWSLVNSTGSGDQGFYFNQKLTNGTVANLGAIYGDASRAQLDLYVSPVIFQHGLITTEAFIGVNGSTPLKFYVGAVGDTLAITIAATGCVSIAKSLLQNKAVATPLTGDTVTMTADQRYQAIAPAGTISALTLVLPPSPVDNQAVSAGSSQIVTALTVNAGTGGASLVGAPTTLAASSGFTMIYQASNNTWYRAA